LAPSEPSLLRSGQLRFFSLQRGITKKLKYYKEIEITKRLKYFYSISTCPSLLQEKHKKTKTKQNKKKPRSLVWNKNTQNPRFL
jgi:hypothetical protein